MGIFPQLNTDLQNQIDNINQTSTETTTKIGRSFLFNFDTKKFEINDGKVRETNELQALTQWIDLILRTYKFKFNVYKDTSFYCNVEDLIGKKINSFYKSELDREIREALLKSNHIKAVQSIEFTQVKNKITIDIIIKLENNELLEYSTTL